MPDEDKKRVEIGQSGLNFYNSGFIQEEFLPDLRGNKAVQVYREMSDNDSVIGAILFVTEMMLRQVKWSVEPASSRRKDIRLTEFVESCMDDMSMSWEGLIAEILSMLVYGWSYHEIVYKRRMGDSQDPGKRSRFDDGLIGWRKIPIRSQDSLYKWEFDENGGVKGMWQQAPPDYSLKFIPIEKALLFRTTSRKNNPEGRSVLRNAYRAWYFKKKIEEIEGIGIERDLAGLPIAWVPPELLSVEASNEERAVLESIKNIVRNVRRDEQEGIVFPLAYDENGHKLYDFDLLSTGGTRQFDTDSIIARYDQRIAMTIMADFILLGHEKVGSFSLSSSKTHIFSVALSAWLKEIADVFNRFAIPRLFSLNGFDNEELPRLVYSDIESIPLDELGEYIQRLSGAGVELFPDIELENHLRRVANLPLHTEVAGG